MTVRFRLPRAKRAPRFAHDRYGRAYDALTRRFGQGGEIPAVAA